jgi:hypothetical protein
MKARLLFLIVFISFSNLWAQDSTIVVIKTGNTIQEVLKNKIYLNPEYIMGTVLFRDNSRAKAKMNYNSLYDQMLFIDQKGDTLAVKDEKEIQYVVLNTDTFYYKEGYKKVVETNGSVTIAEKSVWEVSDIRKIGSHNRASNTYQVDSYHAIADYVGLINLILNQDVIMRKKPVFYLGDKYGRLVPATKKNLLFLFPKQEDRIADYLKENKINFSSREDLVRLTRFLEQKS